MRTSSLGSPIYGSTITLWRRWRRLRCEGLAGCFAAVLLSIFFAVIYYFAPDVKRSQWHWLTPGAAIGIVGWALASIGLRLYVHLFNNYSVTYGSLGAVIILLTWFYLTGLMLLLGAEINSEIEAAAAAKRLLVLEQNDLAAATASAMQVPDSSAPKPAA
ncbi:YhjD/YihY/BrkB family envelope integrity protein [Tunturiibacter empetritectus]|uniref:YihY/virulence factor BrkB family protein n=1 Tax=Tunturiibacter empetritectus TaxID=3069691 RepID=UPI003D9B05A7